MDLQNPRVQKILITSLLCVVVVYVFFGSTFFDFTYRARKTEIAELESQYDKLSRDLERARLTARNLPKLEQEYEYLHQQWLIARNLLPEENEMEPLLRKISAAAQQAGLIWVNFKPNPPMRREYYTENPIQIEVEGNFHQVGSFLSSVSNLNRIVNVRNIKLDGVPPEQQGEDDVLHSMVGTLEIVAYTVPDATAPVADSPRQNLSSADQRLGRSTSTTQRLQAARADAGDNQEGAH